MNSADGDIFGRCSICDSSLKSYSDDCYQFTIDCKIYSQNVIYNKGSYSSMRRYRSLRDEYIFSIKRVMVELRIPDAIGRRRIHVVRQFGKGKRKFDRGNLIGGCKPLLDAMRACSFIVDDTVLMIEDHYSQVKSKNGSDSCVIYAENMY